MLTNPQVCRHHDDDEDSPTLKSRMTSHVEWVGAGAKAAMPRVGGRRDSRRHARPHGAIAIGKKRLKPPHGSVKIDEYLTRFLDEAKTDLATTDYELLKAALRAIELSLGSIRAKNLRSSPEYGRIVLDVAFTVTPVPSQVKVILPAYYAADAMYSYYVSHKTGEVSEVTKEYLKRDTTRRVATLQTEIIWDFSGADKFVPPQYRAYAKQALNTVMTRVSEKELDFVERYLEKQTTS